MPDRLKDMFFFRLLNSGFRLFMMFLHSDVNITNIVISDRFIPKDSYRHCFYYRKKVIEITGRESTVHEGFATREKVGTGI